MEVNTLADKTQATETGGSQSADAATGAPGPASRPEWLPEDHWDPQTNAIKDGFGDHYRELSEFRKQHDERLAALPKDPSGYEITVPEDIELPEGLTREQFAIAADDPHLAEIRKVAHEAQIDPATLQKIVGVGLKREAAQVKIINDRVAEEQQKLGPDGASRVTAIGKFLEAQIGEPLAQAALKGVFTADQVKAFEALQKKFTAQGATSVNADTNPPEPKVVPWEKRMWPKRFAAGS